MENNESFKNNLKNELKKKGAETVAGVIVTALVYGTIYGAWKLYFHYQEKKMREENQQPMKEVTGTDATDESKEVTDAEHEEAI